MEVGDVTKAQRVLWEYLGRPVVRSIVAIIAAVSYNLGSTYALLYWLPSNFNYYNTLISNQGTTVYDAYLFWTWIPTLIIFMIGLFWASGLFGKMLEWIGL